MEYVRAMAARDGVVALKKKETAELLAAFDKYEAELRRLDGLEAAVGEAEKALAEITKKYLDMIQEGYEE